jgi:hypothetical protein
MTGKWYDKARKKQTDLGWELTKPPRLPLHRRAPSAAAVRARLNV